jgi:hypothetical protein
MVETLLQPFDEFGDVRSIYQGMINVDGHRQSSVASAFGDLPKRNSRR